MAHEYTSRPIGGEGCDPRQAPQPLTQPLYTQFDPPPQPSWQPPREVGAVFAAGSMEQPPLGTQDGATQGAATQGAATQGDAMGGPHLGAWAREEVSEEEDFLDSLPCTQAPLTQADQRRGRGEHAAAAASMAPPKRRREEGGEPLAIWPELCPRCGQVCGDFHCEVLARRAPFWGAADAARGEDAGATLPAWEEVDPLAVARLFWCSEAF